MKDFKVGECLSLFVMAIVFDVVGVVVLFVGIFGGLRGGPSDDQFYGDFLIYTGSLVIFISIGFWLTWYVGNIMVSDEDLDDHDPYANTNFSRLVRKLSEKLNPSAGGTVRGDPCVKLPPPEDAQVRDPSARKASRVTWGKSSAFQYQNEGYDASLDYEQEKEQEQEKEKEQEQEQSNPEEEEEEEEEEEKRSETLVSLSDETSSTTTDSTTTTTTTGNTEVNC